LGSFFFSCFGKVFIDGLLWDDLFWPAIDTYFFPFHFGVSYLAWAGSLGRREFICGC
jgi:hypothetical protein